MTKQTLKNFENGWQDGFEGRKPASKNAAYQQGFESGKSVREYEAKHPGFLENM